MNSLIIVNLSNCINPFKRHNGLKYLIEGVLSNRESLIEVRISGNHYNNDDLAVQGIKRMFFELIHVKTLDISCMGLNKKDCKKVIGAFKEVNE